MTLEQKIGQVLVIGFDGKSLDADFLEMVTNYHIGGVTIFARNVVSPAQITELTNHLQRVSSAAGNPGLLVAVDQEGGPVARLTTEKGFTQFPSAMAISATGDPENARLVAAIMAKEMRAVGINANYAPVLDVNNNPFNPIIGARSFGSDPMVVARFGVAFLEGLQNQGIAAFGKHFPGHGDTTIDTHLGMPVIAHDRRRLAQVELAPFKAAIQAGVAGIMSAHIIFPALDPNSVLPATVSPAILTGLIRQEMKFQGAIATDSLEMGAMSSTGWPVERAAPAALAAGADILLLNRDHDLHKTAFQSIRNALRDGLLQIARLNEAVLRILTLKAHFNLIHPNPVNVDQARQLCASPPHQAIALQVAQQSITLLRNRAGLLPLADSDKPIVIESPLTQGLAGILRATRLVITDQPSDSEIAEITAVSGNGQPVILGIANQTSNPIQSRLVDCLLAAKAHLILIAVHDPYDLMRFPSAATMLATYGSHPPVMQALAAILIGKVAPSGHLPVELPGLFPIKSGMTYNLL